MADQKPRRDAMTPRGGTTTVTKSGMARKTVYFSEQEWSAIREAAYTRGASHTDVVREAIRTMLDLPAPADE